MEAVLNIKNCRKESHFQSHILSNQYYLECYKKTQMDLMDSQNQIIQRFQFIKALILMFMKLAIDQ